VAETSCILWYRRLTLVSVSAGGPVRRPPGHCRAVEWL